MSTQSADSNNYDDVPFPSQQLPQTHPDRLATLGILFGMRPAPVERCRVLELGCASGSNLIPMADQLPNSQFVGIDYSKRQIMAAQLASEELGLKNIDFQHLSILDVGEQLGQFDYIVCHGVYSWVPNNVQEKILEIFRQRLNPQGIGYLSYNTYPGWHFRAIVRDLLLGAAAPTAPAAQRIAESRRVLQFFSNTLTHDQSAFGALLKAEIDVLTKQTDSYLFHEYLEEENHPTYFHEFAERLAAHGIQYLGDALPSMMFAANFGPEVEDRLMRMSRDVVEAEQHLDLIRNRSFRQTLVCHQEVPLQRHVNGKSLERLYFAGEIQPKQANPDLKSNAEAEFASPNGSILCSVRPVAKAALYHLGSVWPRALSIDELAAAAARLLASDPNLPAALSPDQREEMCNGLVTCLIGGFGDVHSGPDRFVTAVSRCPRAGRLARLQASAGALITNQRHEAVQLDSVGRNILRFLDGQRDRDALLKELSSAVDRGELSILRNGIPANRGDTVINALSQGLDHTLAKLATRALLIG